MVVIGLLCGVIAVAAVLAFVAVTNQFSSPGYEKRSVALLGQLASPPSYEYKTVEFYGVSAKREGAGAFKFSAVEVDQGELNALGAEGWQVVGTFLEMETAWANFGNDKYVTGLQPNVRPQRVVMILQRRVAPTVQ